MLLQLVAVTATLTIFFTQPALCEYHFRRSKIKKLTSCRLQEFFTQQTATESALRCKFTCLQDADCIACQWDAASGSCQIQDKLHVTPSTSDEDTVELMINVDLPVTCLTDCADILARDPSSESGVYGIIAGGQFLKQVWCDMDTDGGGWTVFLKRLDGSVDFYQDRAAYKEGFGDVSGEYWLGLDALHAMTTAKTYKLRVDLSDWENATAVSLHDSMLVGDEAEQYQLTIGSFTGGSGGDALLNNQGRGFSTYDLDVDTHSTKHCAQSMHGAWWYNRCSRCFPASKYYHGGAYISDNNDGMQWRSWTKHDDSRYSMKTLAMKLRP